MTNHTPGPWVVCKYNDLLIKSVPEDKYVHHGVIPLKERRANTRLMAAAPEMLEALKFALVYVDKYCYSQGYCPPFLVSEPIVSAIQKAEGE